jgi:hypothetical protein
MANPGYLRSTDGSDADDGSTWALANATMAGAITDAAAGDTIYVSQAHAATVGAGANVTWTFPGTIAAPNKVIGGSDAAEPPTSLTSPAAGYEQTTGTGDIIIAGTVHFYNFYFKVGDGTGASEMTVQNTAGHKQRFTDCKIDFNSNNATNVITVGLAGLVSSTGIIMFEGCAFDFANAGHSFVVNHSAEFRECTFATSAAITSFIKTLGTAGRGPGYLLIEGCDLSPLASTLQIFPSTSAAMGAVVTIRNCKIPASATLAGSGITTVGYRAEMYNCDSGDTNYRLWIEEYTGSIRDETTIIRTGGASDGTTGLSWKMATSASAEFAIHILRSPEIVRWNETTGSAITVTVEIVHDSQGSGTSSAFTNKEIWLEVQYLGTSGVPLSLFVSDEPADILTAATDQTSSSETWTTTGLATPVKQKLSVSFTPQEKGFIHATVCMAGASDTAYVDPKLTIS